jgi:bacillithiol system protein YtxJ
MPAIFTELDSVDKLEQMFARSFAAPVAVFKHSNSCGISAGVYRMVGEIDAEIDLIIVQKNRDVSDLLAERTGIRHESPQAFIIRDGRAVYHASHYSIDPEAMALKLKEQ